MKTAGGLTIILIFGALGSIQALNIPVGNKDFGAGVSFDKENGLTLSQSDTQRTESHKNVESEGSSHISGPGGNVKDSEYSSRHEENKEDETRNTRNFNVGKDGLNFVNTKESSGTSQQIDESSNKTHEKNEETGNGYSYKKESDKSENNLREENNSYKKKETSGFGFGQDGFKKGKTEKSEETKKSIKESHSDSLKEVEEESIQDEDKKKYRKSVSNVKNAREGTETVETARQSKTDGHASDSKEDPNESSFHYSAFGENINSSDVDGVKSLSSSGFVQEDSKLYTHVGGESWTKTGVEEVDDLFTNIDQNDGGVFSFGSKRRKRNTVHSSQNIEFERGHNQEINHNSYGSQNSLLENNEHVGVHENHQSLGIQHGNQNGLKNQHQSGQQNHLSEHGQHQVNIGNYRSGESNHYSTGLGNNNHFSVHNGIRSHVNENHKGYQFSDHHEYDRSGNVNRVSSRNLSNGKGRQLQQSNNGGNSQWNKLGTAQIRNANNNLGSRGYRLNSQNSGPGWTLRNSNINFRNGVRNNLSGGSNYGSKGYKVGNGFKINSLGKIPNYNHGLQNGGQVKVQYRKGVKHDDVLNFLTKNGRRLSNEHQGVNTGHHIGVGFRPSSNYFYPRRNSGYKHGNNNLGGNLGAVDLHHFANNIHYATGNGRYVFIPGQKGAQHRYFDTITGLHFSGHKITLHNGNHVIVPGNYVGNAGNGSPGVGTNLPTQGIDLGFGISYLGEGKYLHQGQIILSVDIAAYLKSLGITSIQLNANGLPLGLVGQFPLDLGSGITYQGDGTYKYKDTIVPSDQIIEFCKSKQIDGISFINGGFPAILFDGSLSSKFDNNLTLPIHLDNDLDYIGNNHYKWKDQIIPSIKIGDFIKDHDLNVNVTTEGLPVTIFNVTLGSNTTINSVTSNADDHLNPNGIFPYTVGPNIVYDGKGNYIHNNITIPRSNIVEYCKANNINISLTTQRLPASLFGEEHDEGSDLKYPVYLSEDLSYLGSGHYKYRDQIILASNIGDFIKEHNLNVHVTKEGVPLAAYFGGLDDIFVPDETDGQETYVNDALFYQDHYPLDLGSNLTYFINGSYGYNNEIINRDNIIEFCKSKSINNISFVDGYPSILFNSTDDGAAGSDIKFPIDVGDDLLYYKSGLYRHINKTIPRVDIIDYVKEHQLNVSLTDDGWPTKLVDVNLDSTSGINHDDNIAGIQKNSTIDINGDYGVGSNVSYIVNGTHNNDEIIPITDTSKGSNTILSHDGTNETLRIDIGKGLYYLGNRQYEYENQIYSADNITDKIKELGLNITLNDDNIPLEVVDEQEYNSGDVPIDLGHGFLYDHKNFIYNNEIIPTDEIVEFCKSLNLTVTFSDGYPQLYDDNDVQISQQSSNCPKGPVDLGEGLIYVGDCNYMYQDHVIPSKYILGLLDILHIHDIELPVGPEDDYSSKGDSNNSDSNGQIQEDLGFGVYYLGNDTYKYKNRYIAKRCYSDFLKILGLKIQSEGSEKLVEDGSKSDKSDEEILELIDQLIKSNNNSNSTAGNKNTGTDSSTSDGANSGDANVKNNSSNDDSSSGNQQSSSQSGTNDGSNSSSAGGFGDSSTTSTNNSTSSSSNDSTTSAGSNNSSSTSSSSSNSTTSGSSGDASSSTNTTASSTTSNNSNTTSATSSTNSSSTDNIDSTKTSSPNSIDSASNADDSSTASDSSSDSSKTQDSSIVKKSTANDTSSLDSSDKSSNSDDSSTISESSSNDASKTQDSSLVNNSTADLLDSNNNSKSSGNAGSSSTDSSVVLSSTSSSDDTSGSSDSASSNSTNTTDSSSGDSNKAQNSTSSDDSSSSVDSNSKDSSSSSDDSKNSTSSGTKESSKETIQKSKQRSASETSSESKESREKKQKDSDGNTTIKKSDSSSEKKSKKEATKEAYKKTDDKGNEESFKREEYNKSSQEKSSNSTLEQTSKN